MNPHSGRKSCKELLIPRNGQLAKAVGYFEVSALVVVIFIESRLARMILIFLAAAYGLISIAEIAKLLDSLI